MSEGGRVGTLARDQSIREDEVQAALTVEFAGGEEVQADERSDGSESDEDLVAMVVSPVKGAKVHKLVGENTHVRSTVMTTEPTMAKP